MQFTVAIEVAGGLLFKIYQRMLMFIKGPIRISLRKPCAYLSACEVLI